MAKGQKTDTDYGNELTGIFRGFGEERDEEATGELEARLNQCPTSDQRDQARWPSNTQGKPPSNSLRILIGSRVFEINAARARLPSASCRLSSPRTLPGAIDRPRSVLHTQFHKPVRPDPWIVSLMLGGLTKGHLSTNSGFIRSTASLNPFSLKPLPAYP
jgi:hypothetical protein